jgi:hypothetical protein
MREIAGEPAAARRKGVRAREDMVRRFSLERMGAEVAAHVDRIRNSVVVKQRVEAAQRVLETKDKQKREQKPKNKKSKGARTGKDDL